MRIEFNWRESIGVVRSRLVRLIVSRLVVSFLLSKLVCKILHEVKRTPHHLFSCHYLCFSMKLIRYLHRERYYLTNIYFQPSNFRNPAVDKQAAARCWRDGQKKRCFTYRFLATGTVEEKIFQRQLAKEGLQSVVDDKEQVNSFTNKDLRNLFKLRSDTPSDTHDKLKCMRCKTIQDDGEMLELKVLPKKLAACLELVDKMMKHEDAQYFLNPLNSQDHSVSKEEYEKRVKQPMDLGVIKKRLSLPTPDGKSSLAYKSVSNVSKDVNRIFSNVMKVWTPGNDPIADCAGRLQCWWIEQWQELVPVLMSMKTDSKNLEDNAGKTYSGDTTNLCSITQNERGVDYQEQIGM